MNTKLGKVVTYSESLPFLKPHAPLIFDNFKNLNFHYHKSYD